MSQTLRTETGLRRSLLLVVLLALLWGSSYALMKVAVETIPPVTVAAVRALLGGLLLLAALGPRWRLLLQPGTPKALLTQGFFNCILPWTLVAWASRIIDSGLATILASSWAWASGSFSSASAWRRTRWRGCCWWWRVWWR